LRIGSWGRFFEDGGSPVVKVVHVVERVVSEAVFMEEIAGIAPAAGIAEVECLATELLGDVGEEVFGMALGLGFNVHKSCFWISVACWVGQIRGYPSKKV
jgi:hypothetical protein